MLFHVVYSDLNDFGWLLSSSRSKFTVLKNRNYFYLGAINQLADIPSVAGEESPVNGSVES